MIIFYGSDFKLNITNLNIKFIEESSFFFSSFYKNYTPPFSMPLDDETSLKLGLIDVDNVAGYTVKHEGKLQIDTKFYEASLLLEVKNQNIEGSLFYGVLNMPLLETPLQDLPFKTITTPTLILAEDYIDKSWPEVSCNFPMVYDDNFENNTNYDEFLGIVNNFDGTDYVLNFEDVDGKIFNKNIMTPFPYILEILKVGFASENKDVTGGFMQRKENAHLLLDPQKHLEEFSSNTSDDFQFTNPTDQFLSDGILISEYAKDTIINSIGTYNIKININLPATFTVKKFTVTQDTTLLFESSSNSVQKELTINQEVIGSTTVAYNLQLEGDNNSIVDFNSVSFEKSEGKLNTIKNVFSLAELMPDMTFGKFLEKLKNWLNLKIEIRPNYVLIDYVEDLFNTIDFTDESAFEIVEPKREFNQKKRYKLTTQKPYAELFIDKNGISTSIDDIRAADIEPIETGVSIYPIEERNGIFTAVRSDGADFGIVMYNGKDANGYPVAASVVEGASFSLQEVYRRCWSKWLYFRLNSETYTDKFTAHSLEEFNTTKGRFKYNKKHINKKITKQRISEEQYLYEIESETL